MATGAPSSPLAAASNASASPCAASSEWQFLEEWFCMLGDDEVAYDLGEHDNQHDVRVGTDSTDDAWLSVSLDLRRFEYPVPLAEQPQHEDDSVPEDPDWPTRRIVQREFALMRDAVLITSIVGKVDYEGWYAMMEEYASFPSALPQLYKVPINGVLPRVPIQFRYKLDGQHHLKFLDFSGFLGHVFGSVGHSDDYIRDLQRVREVLTTRGIPWESIPPTRIKLDVALDSTATTPEDVSRRLLRTVEVIQCIRRLEEDARENGDGVADRFDVASLGVGFTYVKMHADVLEALTSLVRVGVPICRLCLPAPADTMPTMSRWGMLVRLITGLDTNDQGSIAKVHRLEMPIAYAATAHFGMFCSALSCSKGLDVFVLSSAGPVEPNELAMRFGDDPFGWSEEIRCHVWRCVMFALFSKWSASSVTTFFCSGGRPGKAEIDVIRQIVESEEPLKVLLQASFPNQELGTVERYDGSKPSFTIRPHAIFRASDGICIAESKHTHELVGESVGVDPEGELVIFVPGYGLCRGQVSEMHQKRVRVEASMPRKTAQRKSLVMCSKSATPIAQDMLVAFLKVIDSQLDGLRLVTPVDEKALNSILQSCRHLRSLAIDETTLSSMDVFDRAYADGLKLTSLKLGKIKVPAEALQEFMRKLAVECDQNGATASVLERLDCEFEPSDEPNNETLKLIEQVLRKNTVLTDFHGQYYEAQAHDEPALSPLQFEDYNGARIRLSQLQKTQLVAFLGGLRAVASANTHLLLDDRIKQRIWEFVASPKYRHVQWYAWSA